MIKTPILHGLAQSDLDMAGFDLLNFSGGGDGGGGFQFDVTQYGATGDGVTDDGAAIRAALVAIPSTGGLLYFPAGTYNYTGATLTLDKPVTVLGDGGGVGFVTGTTTSEHGHPAITTLDFNSSTGTLFDVQKDGCAFLNIGLRNTSLTAPTTGAGILVSARGDRTRYENITVDGFYIDIDVQAGSSQTWDGCFIVAPVLYGLKLRNILVPDGGDHAISNCAFYDGPYTPTSAIRIESGGGVKIVNSKVVGMNPPVFVNGIDLAVGAGVVTVDLLVSNCSIESCSAYGIKCTTGAGGYWTSILITGNQIGPYVNSNPCAIFIDGSGGTLGGITITGNNAYSYYASSSPAISLANCTDVVLTGNLQLGFSQMLSLGAGVTFADSPVYIGRDARLVSISGGAKLQVRNPGTDLWADGDSWTNP